ncbi:MAG TPA: CorA family divalent cation transporter [Candidatus Paceibacterota bacterium]|jgi:Mg2+ and Co2+ transporters
MIRTYTYKKATWVDVEDPTIEDVREIVQSYSIHPLAAEELLVPSARSKAERFDDYVYLALKLPTGEVDFIVGRDFIVTAHQGPVDSLHHFSKMFEVNSVLERNRELGEHAGFMFYYIIRALYYGLSNELESVREALTEIEAETFSGRERDMVFEISKVSRELLAFKHATALHEEVLSSFSLAARGFFPADFSHYLDDAKSECLKVHKEVHSLSESLHELRETNGALLETKQNKIMQTFTAITVVSAVVTIVFNWFLIEADDTPFAHSPHEFALVGAMALAAALLVVFIMMRKKWL